MLRTFCKRRREVFPALALRLVLLGMAVHATTASIACAQEQTPRAPPTYRQLVQSGLQHYQARNYVEAHALLLEAHRMWPNARTLRGLCRVSSDLQWYRQASRYCDEADKATVQPLDESLRQEVRSLRDKARDALAHLTVRASPSDATIQVDGVRESLGPHRQLTLNPGAHIIEASAPGYTSGHLSITLGSGEQTSCQLLLEPNRPAPIAQPSLPPPEPPPAKEPARPGRPSSWLLPTGLSLVAVGALGAGLGAATFVDYLGRGDELRREDTVATRSRWRDGRQSSFVWAAVGSGVLSAGAAALAPTIPTTTRTWLAPTLAVVGGGTLATGLVLLASNPCNEENETALSCSRKTEARDGGGLLAMVSVPLLTIPLFYAIEWLLAE